MTELSKSMNVQLPIKGDLKDATEHRAEWHLRRFDVILQWCTGYLLRKIDVGTCRQPTKASPHGWLSVHNGYECHLWSAKYAPSVPLDKYM
eukprot:1491098-Prymnesium_polylepis.1